MSTHYLWQQELQRIADEAKNNGEQAKEVTDFISSGKMQALNVELVASSKKQMITIMLRYLASEPAWHRPNIARHLYATTWEDATRHEAAEAVLRHIA